MYHLNDNLKKKIYRTLSIILVLVCIVTILDSCQQEIVNKDLKRNLSKLNLENQSFKTELTEKGDSIAIQSQIILSQKEAINNGLIEIERLKNIKSKVSVVTKTKIDTVFIPYSTISYDSTSLSDKDELKFKNYFNYKDKDDWFTINGFATQKGIGIDSLWVKNDYSIYIADQKLGLFKKAEPSVMLINRNPYTETIKMNNVVIKYYKPFYKKNWFWGGLGLVGGFILAK